MTALQVVETTEVLRIGLKGPQAVSWMQQQGLPLPDQWRWMEQQGMLICRLGQSEFVLEAGLEHARMLALNAQLQQPIAGVYPVARFDASWLISGEILNDVLAELCMLDWQLETIAQKVCMTQLAGINATLIQVAANGDQCVRIWCDGSYRDYLHQVFVQSMTSV